MKGTRAHEMTPVSTITLNSEKVEISTQDYRTSKLYAIIKPLITLMKIGGVHYEPINGVKDEQGDEEVRFDRRLVIYSYALLIFEILNFTRIASSLWFGSEDYDLAAKVIIIDTLVQLPLFTIAFIQCSRKCKIRNFVQTWEALQKMKRPFCPEFEYESALKKARLIILLMFVFETCGGIFNCFYFFFDENAVIAFLPYIAPASKDHPHARVFLLLQGLSTFWHMAKLMGLVTILFAFGFTIYKEFLIFRHHFENAISPDGAFLGDFQRYRLWHIKICDLVQSLDDILKFPMLVFFTNVTPCFCIVLYVLIVSVPSHVLLTVGILMMVSVVFCLMYLAIGIGWIHHPAHQPLESAYRIDSSRNMEMAAQVILFTSRLNGPSIGLTAMDLFTIDKTMVLTFFGTIVTYCVVAYQMAPAKLPPDHFFAMSEDLIDRFRNGTEFFCKISDI